MSQRESESFVCARVLERDQKDGGTRSAFRFFTCFLEPLLLAADSRGGNASFFFEACVEATWGKPFSVIWCRASGCRLFRKVGAVQKDF